MHDLKHTVSRRLRAAGVSFEDRQDLLGHNSAWIMPYHSQTELSNLLVTEVRDAGESRKNPAVTWLRHRHGAVTDCHRISQAQTTAVPDNSRNAALHSGARAGK